MDVVRANDILRALTERQKTEPTGAFPGDDKLVKLGSFKVSNAVLRFLQKEFGEKFTGPDMMLFKQHKKLIDDLDRKEIAKLFAFGDTQEDWTKVQDFLAGNPKKAMQRFLMNAQKVSPKLARNMRAMPENVPLWFYTVMVRVGGEELAKVIFGKHFMSEPYYAWKGKIKKKGKEESMDVRETNELLEMVTEGLMNEGSGDVFASHQKKIALATLKMHKVGASIMGGMDHKGAVAVLRKQGMKDKAIEKLLSDAGHSDEDIKDFMGEDVELDEASESDKRYDTRIKLPKISIAVDVGGAVRYDKALAYAKKIFPDYTKADHMKVVSEMDALVPKLQKQYEKELDAAAQEVWSRPIKATDYKISCIYSNEFSDKRKNVLRKLCKDIQRAKDIRELHSKARGVAAKSEESIDVIEVNEMLKFAKDELMDEAKKGSSKLQKLKAKYMDVKTGRFKGGKGERFDNCVAFMNAKGGVDDPEALCGSIARGKGMAPGGSKFGK